MVCAYSFAQKTRGPGLRRLVIYIVPSPHSLLDDATAVRRDAVHLRARLLRLISSQRNGFALSLADVSGWH